MALGTGERQGVRKTIYAMLGVGAIIGAIAFFFGADAWRLVQTAVFQEQSEPRPVSLRVQLFNDVDQDLERDPLAIDEHLITFAEVSLSGNSNYGGTSGPSGELTFAGVLPGTYTVTATLDQVELSLEPSSIEVIADSQAQLAVLSASSSQALGVIEGDLILDSDGDGIANDHGLAGIEMQLLINGGLVAQTSTGEDGRYVFENVVPGVYTVTPVFSKVQEEELSIDAIPQDRAVIRSSIDRVQQQLLIRTRDPVSLGPQYILTQASPTAGFLVTKLGFDADEPGVEFIHGRPGDTLRFTIEVEPFMSGPGTVSNVTVVDTLPSILTPSSISSPGTYSNGRITWTFSSLPSGQKQTLTYDASIAASAADGYYDNTVTVTGTQAQSAEDDVTAVISEKARASLVANSVEPGAGPASATGTTTGNQTPSGTPAPATGVDAWVVTLIASLLVLVTLVILMAGYRRTGNTNAGTH